MGYLDIVDGVDSDEVGGGTEDDGDFLSVGFGHDLVDWGEVEAPLVLGDVGVHTDELKDSLMSSLEVL